MNISKIYDRFGRPCSFREESGEIIESMSAFISPLRYKNKMYLYGVNTEIGYNPEGYYLYIGPAKADITDYDNGRYIECGGEKYRIDRAEKVYRGISLFYIWAVLRKMVELEEDEDE